MLEVWAFLQRFSGLKCSIVSCVAQNLQDSLHLYCAGLLDNPGAPPIAARCAGFLFDLVKSQEPLPKVCCSVTTDTWQITFNATYYPWCLESYWRVLMGRVAAHRAWWGGTFIS